MSQADDIDAMQIGPDPDKLFVYHRQQLSAMLDGELSPDEAKFMLRRLQHDADLAACWERWQVCGDMLRGRHNALLPSDFAGRVASAVAGDASVAVEQARDGQAARPRLMRWGGGAAMAASVALLAVFAGRQLPDAGPVTVETAPAAMVAASPTAVTPAPQAADALDAVADAGNRTPAPDAPARDASAALAAAVAVAEVPRRAAERRSRTQSQRASVRAQQVRREAEAPMALAANAGLPPAANPLEDDALAVPSVERNFAMPPAATARPWPRALLPSAEGAFTVGFGQLSHEPVFEPFRPRNVVAPNPVLIREGLPRLESAPGNASRP